jgi:hypothetical protein
MSAGGGAGGGSAAQQQPDFFSEFRKGEYSPYDTHTVVLCCVREGERSGGKREERGKEEAQGSPLWDTVTCICIWSLCGFGVYVWMFG